MTAPARWNGDPMRDAREARWVNCCAACGSLSVSVLLWCDATTDAILDSASGGNLETWCPRCEANGLGLQSFERVPGGWRLGVSDGEVFASLRDAIRASTEFAKERRERRAVTA